MKDWFDAVLADVVNPGVKVSDVLRKAKILATQLHSSDLNLWIDSELNGYDYEKVPEYRILPPNLQGNFSGPFQSSLRHAAIPITAVPDEIRKLIASIRIKHSIGEIEGIASADSKSMNVTVPPQIAGMLDRVYIDMECYAIWQQVPMSSFVGIIDAVRNRLLNFMLELTKVQDDLLPIPDRIAAIPEASISRAVTIMTGDILGSNIAINDGQIHGSTARYGSDPEVANAISRMAEMVGDLVNVDRQLLTDAIEVLAKAAEGEVDSKLAVVAAAEKVVSVPPLRERLVEIRNAFAVNLASSVLWDAIKLALS